MIHKLIERKVAIDTTTDRVIKICLSKETGKPTQGKDGNLVGGGHAQAIWTMHPSIVVPDSARSLQDFGLLSDHHQPLVYEISLANAISKEGPAPANLRRQMRVLKKGMRSPKSSGRGNCKSPSKFRLFIEKSLRHMRREKQGRMVHVQVVEEVS